MNPPPSPRWGSPPQKIVLDIPMLVTTDEAASPASGSMRQLAAPGQPHAPPGPGGVLYEPGKGARQQLFQTLRAAPSNARNLVNASHILRAARLEEARKAAASREECEPALHVDDGAATPEPDIRFQQLDITAQQRQWAQMKQCLRDQDHEIWQRDHLLFRVLEKFKGRDDFLKNVSQTLLKDTMMHICGVHDAERAEFEKSFFSTLDWDKLERLLHSSPEDTGAQSGKNLSESLRVMEEMQANFEQQKLLLRDEYQKQLIDKDDKLRKKERELQKALDDRAKDRAEHQAVIDAREAALAGAKAETERTRRMSAVGVREAVEEATAPLEAELQTLRDTVAGLEALSDRQSAQIDQLLGDVSSAADRTDQLTKERDELAQKNAQLEENIQPLQKARSKGRMELMKAQAAAQVQQRELEEQLAKLSAEKAEAQQREEQLQQHLEALREEVAELRIKAEERDMGGDKVFRQALEETIEQATSLPGVVAAKRQSVDKVLAAVSTCDELVFGDLQRAADCADLKQGELITDLVIHGIDALCPDSWPAGARRALGALQSLARACSTEMQSSRQLVKQCRQLNEAVNRDLGAREMFGLSGGASSRSGGKRRSSVGSPMQSPLARGRDSVSAGAFSEERSATGAVVAFEGGEMQQSQSVAPSAVRRQSTRKGWDKVRSVSVSTAGRRGSVASPAGRRRSVSRRRSVADGMSPRQQSSTSPALPAAGGSERAASWDPFDDQAGSEPTFCGSPPSSPLIPVGRRRTLQQLEDDDREARETELHRRVSEMQRLIVEKDAEAAKARRELAELRGDLRSARQSLFIAEENRNAVEKAIAVQSKRGWFSNSAPAEDPGLRRSVEQALREANRKLGDGDIGRMAATVTDTVGRHVRRLVEREAEELKAEHLASVAAVTEQLIAERGRCAERDAACFAAEERLERAEQRVQEQDAELQGVNMRLDQATSEAEQAELRIAALNELVQEFQQQLQQHRETVQQERAQAVADAAAQGRLEGQRSAVEGDQEAGRAAVAAAEAEERRGVQEARTKAEEESAVEITLAPVDSEQGSGVAAEDAALAAAIADAAAAAEAMASRRASAVVQPERFLDAGDDPLLAAVPVADLAALGAVADCFSRCVAGSAAGEIPEAARQELLFRLGQLEEVARVAAAAAQFPPPLTPRPSLPSLSPLVSAETPSPQGRPAPSAPGPARDAGGAAPAEQPAPDAAANQLHLSGSVTGWSPSASEEGRAAAQRASLPASGRALPSAVKQAREPAPAQQQSQQQQQQPQQRVLEAADEVDVACLGHLSRSMLERHVSELYCAVARLARLLAHAAPSGAAPPPLQESPPPPAPPAPEVRDAAVQTEVSWDPASAAEQQLREQLRAAQVRMEALIAEFGVRQDSLLQRYRDLAGLALRHGDANVILSKIRRDVIGGDGLLPLPGGRLDPVGARVVATSPENAAAALADLFPRGIPILCAAGGQRPRFVVGAAQRNYDTASTSNTIPPNVYTTADPYGVALAFPDTAQGSDAGGDVCRRGRSAGAAPQGRLGVPPPRSALQWLQPPEPAPPSWHPSGSPRESNRCIALDPGSPRPGKQSPPPRGVLLSPRPQQQERPHGGSPRPQQRSAESAAATQAAMQLRWESALGGVQGLVPPQAAPAAKPRPSTAGPRRRPQQAPGELRRRTEQVLAMHGVLSACSALDVSAYVGSQQPRPASAAPEPGQTASRLPQTLPQRRSGHPRPASAPLHGRAAAGKKALPPGQLMLGVTLPSPNPVQSGGSDRGGSPPQARPEADQLQKGGADATLLQLQRGERPPVANIGGAMGIAGPWSSGWGRRPTREAEEHRRSPQPQMTTQDPGYRAAVAAATKMACGGGMLMRDGGDGGAPLYIVHVPKVVRRQLDAALSHGVQGVPKEAKRR